MNIAWATEQESNSLNFVVEHSADGIHRQDIATVNAAGNSSVRNNYMVYDNNPAAGINLLSFKRG